MIRRTVLAAAALAVLGGVSAPAFAATHSAAVGSNQGVCVLGTNTSTGARDGICVWIPMSAR